MDGLVGRHRLSAGACCTIFQVSPAPFLVPTTLSGLSNPLPGLSNPLPEKSVRVQTYQTGSLSFPLLSPPTVAPSYANLTLLNLPLPSSSSPKYPFCFSFLVSFPAMQRKSLLPTASPPFPFPFILIFPRKRNTNSQVGKGRKAGR